MSAPRGPSRGRGRGGGGDRGRGGGDAPGGRGGRGGGRGGGRDSTTNLPFRQNNPRGDYRGRGRGQDSGSRGGRGGGRGGGPPRGGFTQGPVIYSPERPVSVNPQVEKTENAVATALKTKQRSVTSYPDRPGYGTRGTPLMLYANYFELQSVGKELFRYSVDIAGNASPTGRKLRQIISLLIEERFGSVKNSIVTDYKSTLISHVKLDLDSPQYDVRYRSEHEDEYLENPDVYRTTTQFTGTLSPSDLLAYLTSTNPAAAFGSKYDTLQAINIVLGHHPKTNSAITSVGANKHFGIGQGLQVKEDLGNGIEALRGFFVSVRTATARLLVNVQVKYVACYQAAPLGFVIDRFRGGSRDLHNLGRFLKRLRVRVTHIKKKNKKGEIVPRFKTISNLATPADGRNLPMPPKVSKYGAGPRDVLFFLDAPGQQPSQQSSSATPKGKGKKSVKAGPAPAGKYISVADFFKQHYDLDTSSNMPVINVGTVENPSYLPVEACEVEPGQPANSKLTPNQTRNMLKFAVRTPVDNAESIANLGNRVLALSPPNSTLGDFGIKADLNLIKVPGRLLPCPNVSYSEPKLITPQNGSWNMRSIKFSTPGRLTSCSYVWFTAPGNRYFQDSKAVEAHLKGIIGKMTQMGVVTRDMSFIPGKQVMLDRDPQKTPNEKLEKQEKQVNQAISELMATSPKPQLIFTVLPDADSELYNKVKKACDIHYGVRNVNVLADKLSGANDQYYANVGLKVNLKLGGTNQTLEKTPLGIIGEGKTMLVGIDVTHPSPGSSRNAPSVAGMVASIDSSLGQWPAELCVQASREEMVKDLDNMLKVHLHRWARGHKNNLPENLIVYRDGVSEGQYDMVIQEELPLLRKACQEMYPATDTAKGLPRISILIVGKRHHTRFYPTDPGNADRSSNTKNGTVVDRGVTEARNWDFFLQAHTALKGTARPAHYFTVWDEIFFRQKPIPPYQNAADVLEALTHHMCYLFGRATKAVSICPPAYYADLVCTRARCYLSHVFEQTPTGSVATGSEQSSQVRASDVTIHPNVKDTMFYI
ncbi:putative RNA interference and gene silencing protein (Qde2) [Aspergillus affinis]|uniref:putative RNA interference and gene silencing protein (Qde2) n=1 Tax=Aspergillus affinis TaxID=1070780 RepID=UPI0022FEAC3D|nr:Piwi-domain-containing protein [Aspergillus affinis]KAI9044769.1 Piwi-domain-containing protein [Aspergillus affinis]